MEHACKDRISQDPRTGPHNGRPRQRRESRAAGTTAGIASKPDWPEADMNPESGTKYSLGL